MRRLLVILILMITGCASQEIIEKPEIGKPLKFNRRGERSVRIPPFRIIYAVEGNAIYFLDFDKRDKVYR